MELKRKRFQGVLNILSFNRHFYIIGFSSLMAILLIFHIINLPDMYYWIITMLFVYGMMAPLVVSAYVYDFSRYYNFNWLNKFNLKDAESHVNININAGFDETSHLIKNRLPKSDLKVFDFYNPTNHTEPAIIRARKLSMIYPNTKSIHTDHIPLNSNSADNIFLLSAAHEIRSYQEKIAFLKECKRVCKPNGKIIMVEHLRDIPNFFAFSIGFFHFFSKNIWVKAFKEAEFTSIKETKFTPFMSIFLINS